MKRIIAGLGATLLALAGAVALTPTAAATEAETPGVCVPVDPTYETVVVTEAWVEEIEHPEVTEEVLVTEPWTETIEHPAEYEYIEHDAVYEDQVTKREYVKVKHPGYTEYEWVNIVTWKKKWSKSDPGAFWKKTGEERSVHPVLEYKWFPASHNVGDQGWEPTGNVKTERVKVKDAWTEEVLVKDAWTETIDHPAVYETRVVTEAWTEYIEHPEVTEERLVDPGRECPPIPEPEVWTTTDVTVDCEFYTETTGVWTYLSVWDPEAWEYVIDEDPTQIAGESSRRASTPEEIEEAGLDCVPVDPPVEEPTDPVDPVDPVVPDPPAGPQDPVAPISDPVDPADPMVTDEPVDTLAYTGAGDALPLIVVALAAVVGGGVLVAARRVRQAA